MVEIWSFKSNRMDYGVSGPIKESLYIDYQFLKLEYMEKTTYPLKANMQTL